MHINLPIEWEEKLSYWRHKLLPRTLFFRTMLLIFMPLIGVQIVSIVVFFDSSWSRMGTRLADNLVGDMKVILELYKSGFPIKELSAMAKDDMQIVFTVEERGKDIKKHYEPETNKIVIDYLKDALHREFKNSYWKVFYDKSTELQDLVIVLDDGEEVYSFVCSRKKIFSSSIFGFVVWMIITSILLLGVSMLFLRIQVRAIADLATTAENFGKGYYEDGFKPYGSSEVRKAGLAFIKMKERILRQIVERTQMLAGISHDLRTPLTRMKLLATMMDASKDKDDFIADIEEMEQMLNEYLAFVRGEGDEGISDVNLDHLIKNICDRFRVSFKKIKYKFIGERKIVRVKEHVIKRALNNIIANACRYGKKVEVVFETTDKKSIITVDDNGPGIPKDKRDEVFRAFYRLEDSRNKETGGVGLGLAITKNIIVAHGGKIVLSDSDLGGLRVKIELPL